MTFREAVAEGRARLAASPDPCCAESPGTEASLLLALATASPRSRVSLLRETAVDGVALENYFAYVDRRARGEPFAYIAGSREFWGREFRVDSRVLIPRPETEHLVEEALKALEDVALEGGAGDDAASAAAPLFLHDTCTGSGCVGISVAATWEEARASDDGRTVKPLPFGLSVRPRSPLEVSLSDISPDALEVAALNARAILGRDIPLFRGDLLAGLPPPRAPGEGLYHVITANPPYVTEAEMEPIRASGRDEPELALRGGEDGLDPYRRLLPQAFDRLLPGGWLLAEMGAGQEAALTDLFSASGFGDIHRVLDLAGLPRLVKGRKPSAC